MSSINTSMELFGTGESVSKAKDVCVGDFSCRVAAGSVRSLRWQNIEILRALEVSIRDENWGTYDQDDVEEQWEENDRVTTLVRRFTVANGALAGELSISLDPTGQLNAELALTAYKRFSTNRAGFTLLHPLIDVSAEELSVTHSDGNIDRANFPRQVSPHQPFSDIAKLAHRVRHIDVLIEFEGEIFEMEDHRNWTDASFKTYCRLLAKPFPYVIEPGEIVRQTIRIALKGHGIEPVQSQVCSDNVHVDISEKPGILLPEILLASEQDWLPGSSDEKTIAAINADGLLIRLDENFLQTSTWLDSIADLANKAGVYCDVEIIVPSNASPQNYLNQIATLFNNQNIAPRHVISIAQSYMKTISPNGSKPVGASPAECIIAAQIAFPKAIIGTGMLTNFTELNRLRPTPKLGAYITHGTSAIVHAADDVSVFETLESLPYIFETTSTFSANRPSRLGLMSIGIRSNPYGDKVATNPQNIRKAMAQNDPRQAGLFGAAFGIGVAACVSDAGCQALALAATGGPFALFNEKELFPLFHAVKALSAMGGKKKAYLSNLPPHIYGLAATKSDGGVSAIFANCSTNPRQVTFGEQVKSTCLDETSFAPASGDIDWLMNASCESVESILLAPCALAFVEMGAAQ